MRKFFCLILTIVFYGCDFGHDYWQLSRFNMVPNALEDKEEIGVIYSSGCPDLAVNMDSFVHLIVVSKKSGDTVNVLTMECDVVNFSDTLPTYNFFNIENQLKLIRSIEGSGGTYPFMNIKDTTRWRNFQTVVRDPKYDFIAENKFPTLIGTIGRISGNGIDVSNFLP